MPAITSQKIRSSYAYVLVLRGTVNRNVHLSGPFILFVGYLPNWVVDTPCPSQEDVGSIDLLINQEAARHNELATY